MTPCETLRPNAAGIAMLPAGDPDREEYLAHARSCGGCMAALRSGEKLYALLEQAPLPAPSSEALRRASAPIARRLRARGALVRGGAALLAFAALVLLARLRAMDGLAAALIVAAIAACWSATAGWTRDGRWISLTCSGLFAAFAGAGVGLSPLTGLECLALEQVAAALPFAATALLVRRGSLAPNTLMEAAAAGALAGQAALHLTCPQHTATAHLWVFHVGGVALAALLGLLGTRLLTPKAIGAPL